MLSKQLACSPDGPAAAMRKFLATVAELKSQTFQKLSTSVEEGSLETGALSARSKKEIAFVYSPVWYEMTPT